MTEIEKRIEKIEIRNRRVELDKSWEISLTRRLIISIFTYIIVVIFLISIKVENPSLSAIVPVIGYIISTLSIGHIKKFWINYVYKK